MMAFAHGLRREIDAYNAPRAQLRARPPDGALTSRWVMRLDAAEGGASEKRWISAPSGSGTEARSRSTEPGAEPDHWEEPVHAGDLLRLLRPPRRFPASRTSLARRRRPRRPA